MQHHRQSWKVRVATSGLVTALLLGALVSQAPPAPATTGSPAVNAFVSAAFHDLIERAPSDSSVAYWSGRLTAGSTSKAQFLHYLATSDASYETIVLNAYRTILARPPTEAALAGWEAELRSHHMTAAQLAERFYSTHEFVDLRGGGTTSGWVRYLYGILGNTVHETDAQVAKWVGVANSSGRLPVAIAFYESITARTQRVQGIYHTLLYLQGDGASLAHWLAVDAAQGDLAVAEGLALSTAYSTRALHRTLLAFSFPRRLTASVGVAADIPLTSNLDGVSGGPENRPSFDIFGLPPTLSLVPGPTATDPPAIAGTPTTPGTYQLTFFAWVAAQDSWTITRATLTVSA